MPLLYMPPGIPKRARGIVEQDLLLGRRHQPEQVARLLPMIVVDAMVIVCRFAFNRHRRFGEIGLVLPKTCAVGMEGRRSTQIAVRPHAAVAMVALERAFRSVDRDVVEVDTEPVA